MNRVFAIIPTLNAAAGLPGTLHGLVEAELSDLSMSWLVADAGSTDATLEIARSAGCQIIAGAHGRGAQLAAGVAAARRQLEATDWLLFLHADTVLSPGWSRVAKAFMDDPARVEQAGFFRFALDDTCLRARLLERAVNWRCRMLGLPYGDQGLFIRVDFHDRLGGFKPWPLFEDVDMVRRIGKHRLVPLPIRAVTSAERFRREGYGRRSAKNLVLLARYALGAHPTELAKAYRS